MPLKFHFAVAIWFEGDGQRKVVAGSSPMINASSSPYKSAAMYGIQSQELCYVVRLWRRGKKWCKAFAHSTCGGRETALAMAQAWRDEIVKKHLPARRIERAKNLQSSNTSGVSGVYAILEPDGSLSRWGAKTTVDGKAVYKSFSALRFGEQQAKALAIEAREQQLRRVTGRRLVHPQEKTVRRSPAPKQTPKPAPPTARATVIKRNNSSGIPGVHYRPAKNGRTAYWMAITAPGGAKRISKCFAVNIYGEDQAKALAIAEREKQLDELSATFKAPK